MDENILEWLLSKSVSSFKAGKVGEENKWVTLYAYMAQ